MFIMYSSYIINLLASKLNAKQKSITLAALLMYQAAKNYFLIF